MDGYTYESGMASPPPPRFGESEPLSPERPWSVSMNYYKPKKQYGGTIVLIVMVVAALIGVIILSRWEPPAPVIIATPTPPATQSIPAPEPTQQGGLPFDDSAVSGYWKVTNTSWTNAGARLTLEVSVDEDSNSLFCVFYAYAGEDATPIEPVIVDPPNTPAIFIGPGETATVTLFFEVSRQDMILIMTGRGQNQLSALPIES